ncbi:hypothetical protein [Streptomyces sp. NPDC058674]|uniref:hypothetical protein n=1 Tax=Streptomyces sp. NPDC058674 TaxID=3346592 RepID=UPI003665BC17
MGGREHTRAGRQVRPTPRRAVLLTTLGLLLAGIGALFLCARPAPPPAAAPAPAASAAAPAFAAAGHSASGHPAAGHAAAGHAVPAHAAPAVCASPYDPPGCSPLAHVVPVVLPVPAPAAVLAGGGTPAAPAATAPRGRVRPSAPPARAPDLHALQVLRT